MKHFWAVPKGQLRLAKSLQKCLCSERYCSPRLCLASPGATQGKQDSCMNPGLGLCQAGRENRQIGRRAHELAYLKGSKDRRRVKH